MVDDLTSRLSDSSGRSLSVSAPCSGWLRPDEWPPGYGELRQDESHDGPQHGATPEQAWLFHWRDYCI